MSANVGVLLEKGVLKLCLIDKDYHDAVASLRVHLADGEVSKTLDDLQNTLLQHERNGVVCGRFGTSNGGNKIHVGEDERSFDLPLSHTAAEELAAICETSWVGIAREGTVFRPDVRTSKETAKVTIPGLSEFDHPDVLEYVRRNLAPNAQRVEAKLHKLLVYSAGGFFKPHVDTVYTENHFGTLAVALPVAPQCQGGVIKFYQGRGLGKDMPACWMSDDSEDGHDYPPPIAIDFNDSVHWEVVGEEGLKPNTLPFAAWMSDIPHSVARVENGYRVVVVYQLYRCGYTPPAVDPGLQQALNDKLAAIAKGPERILKGVAFVLRHMYPPPALTPTNLKSIDAELYQALHSLNTTPECISVVEKKDDELSTAVLWKLSTKSDGWLKFCKVKVPGDNAATPQPDGASEDEVLEEVVPGYCLRGVIFLELGCGMLAGGGECFGNADCGTEWWYRYAVVVAFLDGFRRWAKVRGLVLSAVHPEGQPVFKKLHDTCPLVFRRICDLLLK